MSNITTTQKDLISFDQSKVDLIRNTVAKDLNPNEFELFISIAKARGLDPILNQIHAVVRVDKVNFQVGIDGFRLIAARTGEFAGRDETEFFYKSPNDSQPDRAKVTVYRFVNGQKCSWTASAKWSEYYPGEKMGFMWKKLPETMLEKCAEAKALRMAFPNDLSGLYEPSEMEQSAKEAKPRDITPKTESPAKKVIAQLEAAEEDPGEFEFKAGKNKGKKIKDFSQDELLTMASDVKNYWKDKQKPIPPPSEEILENIYAHLNQLSHENYAAGVGNPRGVS